jgi:hypothetical protein
MSDDDLVPARLLGQPLVKLVNVETGEVLCEGRLTDFYVSFSRYDGFKSYEDCAGLTIDLGGDPWILEDKPE